MVPSSWRSSLSRHHLTMGHERASVFWRCAWRGEFILGFPRSFYGQFRALFIRSSWALTAVSPSP